MGGWGRLEDPQGRCDTNGRATEHWSHAEVDQTSSAEVDQVFGCGLDSDFLVMCLLLLFSVFELFNILQQHRIPVRTVSPVSLSWVTSQSVMISYC